MTIEKFYFKDKNIKSQKIIREIAKPEVIKKNDTLPGYTGILIDGVEVLNYKSKDKCLLWNFRICKRIKWWGI